MKRIAVYQNDPAFGDVPRNLDAARAALAGVRADLVVLPELFATGYQFASHEEVRALAEPVPGGATAAALEEVARGTDATVVAGIAEAAPDGRIYNAAAVVYPSGALTTYRKVHLFGEERTWFAPGGRVPPVIRTPQGLRIGVMICFDWRFPEVARHLAIEGADVIAHPANLVHAHCPEAMITRCLENRVFAATADRVGEEARGGRAPLRYAGRSQVVSPAGARLGALGADEPGLLLVEIDPAEARSKALKSGCEDVFAARRRDLLDLSARRAAGPRGYAVKRHVTADGARHYDLFLERDGVLMTWRLAAPPRPGLSAERTFDHRLRYLDFEGEIGGGRGTIETVERGAYVPSDERGDRIEFQVVGGPAFRLVLEDAASDLWRLAAG